MVHHRRQASMEAICEIMRPENNSSSSSSKTADENALMTALEQVRKENERLRTTLEDYRKKDVANFADCPPNFYEQLKQKVESPDFLHKLEELGQKHEASDPTDEEGDLVNAGIDHPSWWVWVSNDLFGNGKDDLMDGEYVLVSEEDIIEGIAMFMARYVTSIPKSKTMTTKELQDVIATAFKNMEKKGHLWRIWQMGKFLYSTASWGTAAFRVFSSPMVLRALLMTVSTSMRLCYRLLL